MKNWFVKYEYEIGMDFFNRRDFYVDKSRFSKSSYIELLFANYLIFAMLILIVFMFTSTLFCIHEAWQITVLLGICIVGILVGLTSELYQKTHNFYRRLKKVPKYIKENAKQLYGIEWREPSIECHEGHVFGDCPLCGAE